MSQNIGNVLLTKQFMTELARVLYAENINQYRLMKYTAALATKL